MQSYFISLGCVRECVISEACVCVHTPNIHLRTQNHNINCVDKQRNIYKRNTLPALIPKCWFFFYYFTQKHDFLPLLLPLLSLLLRTWVQTRTHIHTLAMLLFIHISSQPQKWFVLSVSRSIPYVAVASRLCSAPMCLNRHNSWQQHQFYFEKSVTRARNTNDRDQELNSKNAFQRQVSRVLRCVCVAQEMNQQRRRRAVMEQPMETRNDGKTEYMNFGLWKGMDLVVCACTRNEIILWKNRKTKQSVNVWGFINGHRLPVFMPWIYIEWATALQTPTHTHSHARTTWNPFPHCSLWFACINNSIRTCNTINSVQRIADEAQIYEKRRKNFVSATHRSGAVTVVSNERESEREWAWRRHCCAWQLYSRLYTIEKLFKQWNYTEQRDSSLAPTPSVWLTLAHSFRPCACVCVGAPFIYSKWVVVVAWMWIGRRRSSYARE